MDRCEFAQYLPDPEAQTFKQLLDSTWLPSSESTNYLGLVCPIANLELDEEDYFAFKGRDNRYSVPWTAFFTKDESRQLALIVSETGRMNVKPLSNGLIP